MTRYDIAIIGTGPADLRQPLPQRYVIKTLSYFGTKGFNTESYRL